MSEQNKAIVRRFLDELHNKVNLSIVDELANPSYVNHQPGRDAGVEDIKKGPVERRSAFPDLAFTVDDQVAEGDRVVTRWTMTGTQKGEYLGAPPTNQRVTMRGIFIHRLEGGKLAEAWTGIAMPSPPSPVHEMNKTLVRDANEEILNKGDLDAIDELFSADYINHRITGDRRGRDALKQGLDALRAAFPDLQVSVDNLVAEGDRVAWQRTHRGTHQGEYMGIPATGKSVTWRSTIISRVVDDKIVEEWSSSNLAEQLRS